MNAAYLHLVLNHLPLVCSLFGFVILMYGGWRDSSDVIRVGLAVLVLAGVITVPVYHSGVSAEEIAENLVGVSESALQRHRRAARTSYYLGIALGLAGIWGIVEQTRRGQLPRWLIVLIGMLTGAVFVSLLITSRAGLDIRHPEIEIPPAQLSRAREAPPLPWLPVRAAPEGYAFDKSTAEASNNPWRSAVLKKRKNNLTPVKILMGFERSANNVQPPK